MILMGRKDRSEAAGPTVSACTADRLDLLASGEIGQFAAFVK